jgi:CelD/BcsL family acetyltransferase involved in cellulose biosynthesis
MASFGADLKMRVAFKNGVPIASILTLSHKKTVTYKYGCSDARLHPLAGMALLFWNTIQQAKAAGCEKLDLGRSDSSNEGLTAFKEHLGGIRSGLYESLWARTIAGRKQHPIDCSPQLEICSSATLAGSTRPLVQLTHLKNRDKVRAASSASSLGEAA